MYNFKIMSPQRRRKPLTSLDYVLLGSGRPQSSKMWISGMSVTAILVMCLSIIVEAIRNLLWEKKAVVEAILAVVAVVTVL
jgi:hypothetical protein